MTAPWGERLPVNMAIVGAFDTGLVTLVTTVSLIVLVSFSKVFKD